MKTILSLLTLFAFSFGIAQTNEETQTEIYNGRTEWESSTKKLAEKQEIRNVGSFDAIAVAGPFDVTLVSGKEGEIAIDASQEQLEKIKSKVNKDGTLKIELEKTSWYKMIWRSYDKIEVTIPVEDIEKLSLSGSGKIQSEKVLKSNSFKTALSGSGHMNINVDCNTLETKLTGSGYIKVKGTANDISIKLSGSGHIKAKDLVSQSANVKLAGSGSVRLQARENLDASIAGSGNIKYYGNPPSGKLRTNVSGSGSVSSGE